MAIPVSTLITYTYWVPRVSYPDKNAHINAHRQQCRSPSIAGIRNAHSREQCINLQHQYALYVINHGAFSIGGFEPISMRIIFTQRHTT